MGENSYSEVPVSVVGIGASAGGLEAIQELLSALSDNTGMAFVIIERICHYLGFRIILRHHTFTPLCHDTGKIYTGFIRYNLFFLLH